MREDVGLEGVKAEKDQQVVGGFANPVTPRLVTLR